MENETPDFSTTEGILSAFKKKSEPAPAAEKSDQQITTGEESRGKEAFLPSLNLGQSTIGAIAQPQAVLSPTLTPGASPEAYRATQEKLGEKQLAQDIYQSDVAQRMDEAAKHNEVLKQLQSKLPALQKNVADTHAEHLMAEKLDPEAMHREILRQRMGSTIPTPEVSLTKMPLGGAGTEKYAMEFGALPSEAKKVLSMSVMQKSNIPAQAGAYGRISNLFPGESINLYEGYPLLTLGESGEKAVKERMQPTLTPEAEKTAHEIERDLIKRQVNQRKIDARLAHENAKAELEKHHQIISEHKQNAPLGYKPSEREVLSQAEKNAEIMRLRALAKDLTSKGIYIPSRSTGLGSEYTNVYPISGANASYLNMLEQEMKNPKRTPEDIQAYQEEADRIQKQMQQTKTEMPATAKYMQRILPNWLLKNNP